MDKMKRRAVKRIFCDKEEGFLYHINSFSENKVYEVEMNAYGLLRCSCPHCQFRLLQGREGIPLESDDLCKHMKLVLREIRKNGWKIKYKNGEIIWENYSSRENEAQQEQLQFK